MKDERSWLWTAPAITAILISWLLASPPAPATVDAMTPPAAATGEPAMSTGKIRRALKRGHEALRRGDATQAMERYEEVLAATPRGHKTRAEALHALAFYHLRPEASPDGLQGARQALEELRTFHPEAAGKLEVEAALALLDELDGSRTKIADLTRDFDAQSLVLAEMAGASAAARAEGAAAEDAASEELTTLKRQVKRLQQELASVREDLAKKDEALKKVRETLVGGQG